MSLAVETYGLVFEEWWRIHVCISTAWTWSEMQCCRTWVSYLIHCHQSIQGQNSQSVYWKIYSRWYWSTNIVAIMMICQIGNLLYFGFLFIIASRLHIFRYGMVFTIDFLYNDFIVHGAPSRSVIFCFYYVL